MNLSPNYFRVNQLILLNLKLPKKMLNVNNGSEDSTMALRDTFYVKTQQQRRYVK